LLRNPWLAVALLAAVAALCTALGFWQLERAGESRALLDRYAAAGGRSPAPW
jgi:cytochrome oxidase assembly protein ShyY1